MIQRYQSEALRRDFSRGKVIVLLGARQVGKTTLLSTLVPDGGRVLSLNCDDYDDALAITGRTTTELRQLLAPYDVVFIDEAQRVESIGLTLKKIGDLRLGTQVVVTGSSSLELAGGIEESATGRIINHQLFPLSLAEMAAHTSQRDEQRMLVQRMIYGLYPEVVTHPEDAKRTLMTLTGSYLYKDILSYNGIKKPDVLSKLVRALALQVGSEVSYNELSQLIGIDRGTVEAYIGLLEKCFVVFRLDSYSRNLRNEIKKGKKVYFYDNGVRNAVLSNFAPLELRSDTGALWENLMVAERIKRNAYMQSYARLYFWRTHDQKEIDLIEELDGRLAAFEMKWSPRAKATLPAAFAAAYPESSFNVVKPDEYWAFVTPAVEQA